MCKLAPGIRLGPYELISLSGAGGMGEIWKARDIRVGRQVAVKALQRHFANRFEREARAIAALNHPNICSLFDIGPDYLVMEWIDGVPVAAPHSTRKLLDLVVQIADGLSAAHAVGIIHRDLKPANVLVTREGRVKILDFGLAKHADPTIADSELTQMDGDTDPGTIMDTVSYMSPEQVRGLPLDARSDQFSFGVVLYELAGGERPFERETAPQTMAAVIEADPEPLPKTLPAPLRWLILRCLAKEPSGRFESTRDLYNDLNSLRDHLSEISSGTETPLLKPSISQRIWPKTIVAGIVLAGLAVGSYWMGRRSNIAAKSVVPVPVTTNGGIVQNPNFSPDGSQVVFAWIGPEQEAFNLYVKIIGFNELLRLTNDSSDEGSPAWSPDGNRIAFVRDLRNYKCAVLTISPLGGGERKVTDIACADGPSPSGHSLLAWTPGGHYLAIPDLRAATQAAPSFPSSRLMHQNGEC